MRMSRPSPARSTTRIPTMFDDPGPKGERDPNWKPPKTGWSGWEQLTEWDVYVETAKKFSEMMGREVSTEEARALCKAHDRIWNKMVHDFTHIDKPWGIQ